MAGIRTNPKVGIVIGGAIDVWNEYDRTIELLNEAQLEYNTFVTNDSIPLFPDYLDVAVSLHPNKLPIWAQARNKLGRNVPDFVVSIRRDLCTLVTHYCADWGGSSGLYSVRVALELFGCTRVILCGVPMEINRGHIIRGPKYHWPAVQFRNNWKVHQSEYSHMTRSWSGWTMKLLGTPTLEWLMGG